MNEELRAACGRPMELVEQRAWLLPVSLDGSPVPVFSDERRIINDVHHVLLDPDWEDGVRRLLEATVQMTKKRTMAMIDRDAGDLVDLHLKLVKQEAELERATMRQIEEEVSRSLRLRDVGDTVPRPSDLNLSGPNERLTEAKARFAAKKTSYDAAVQAFLHRYGEDHNPYCQKLGEVEAGKRAIAERMRREDEEAKSFARRAMVVSIIVTALITVLIIVLFGR
jgi:hypothetical protein